MADNPKDATSAAPGSGTGTSTPPAKPTPPSSTPSSPPDLTINPTPTPTTPNPNPTPVAPSPNEASKRAKADTVDATTGQSPVKETVEPAPKSDQDWDQPEEVEVDDILQAFEDGLSKYVYEDMDQGDDDNPHYHRQRGLIHHVETGAGGPSALVEAREHLQLAAEAIASYLNGGR